MKKFLSRFSPMRRQSRQQSLKQLAFGFGASLVVGAAILGGLSVIRPADAQSSVWGDNDTQQSSTTVSSSSSVWSSAANSGATTSNSTPSTTPTQTTTAATRGTYAALGDSVAAGLGLPIVSNATAADQQCGRSSQAYPNQVADARGLQLVFAACSGATAGDLVTQQRVNGNNPERQIDAAFAGGVPSLITVTAGANDMHWQDFIKKCYAATCGTSFDNAAVSTLLTAMRAKMTYFLAETRLRSGTQTPPTVILTGYYYPVSANCANQQFTAAEISWLRSSVDRLNQALRQTATLYGFARYVPVSFSGHELCTNSPWVQGLTDAAPVHPTAAGQQAIARSITQSLANRP